MNRLRIFADVAISALALGVADAATTTVRYSGTFDTGEPSIAPNGSTFALDVTFDLGAPGTETLLTTEDTGFVYEAVTGASGTVGRCSITSSNPGTVSIGDNLNQQGVLNNVDLIDIGFTGQTFCENGGDRDYRVALTALTSFLGGEITDELLDADKVTFADLGLRLLTFDLLGTNGVPTATADALITGIELLESDMGPGSEIPLPAAAWFMIAGLSSLGVMRRTRS